MLVKMESNGGSSGLQVKDSGVLNTTSNYSTVSARSITFNETFSTPPTVYARPCSTGAQELRNKYNLCGIYDVTTTGFTLNIDQLYETGNGAVDIEWVAIQ